MLGRTSFSFVLEGAVLSKLAKLKRLLGELGKIDEIIWRLDQISRLISSKSVLGDPPAVPSSATNVDVPSIGVSWEPNSDLSSGVTMTRLGSESLVTFPNGPQGLFVPLDYPGVVQTRTQNYLYEAVRARMDSDRTHIDRFLVQLSPFLCHPSLDKVPDDEQVKGEPYWNNGYFSGDDARFLFAFVATFKPNRVLEIGSGNSTKFMRLALSSCGIDSQIISIDPVPRAQVDGVADIAIEKSLLEVSLSEFDRLEAGDLLFHDGSHLTFNGADTVCLFLEVLPRIKPGVFVHIHDIQLPYEYSASFDGRGYSEQYMLAAALLFGNNWEVLAPIDYLRRTGRVKHGGGSFWMRKVAQP
jgi:hypothetical protein